MFCLKQVINKPDGRKSQMQEASMAALLWSSECNVLLDSRYPFIPFCKTSAPIFVSLAAPVFGVISAWRRCAK